MVIAFSLKSGYKEFFNSINKLDITFTDTLQNFTCVLGTTFMVFEGWASGIIYFFSHVISPSGIYSLLFTKFIYEIDFHVNNYNHLWNYKGICAEVFTLINNKLWPPVLRYLATAYGFLWFRIKTLDPKFLLYIYIHIACEKLIYSSQ